LSIKNTNNNLIELAKKHKDNSNVKNINKYEFITLDPNACTYYHNVDNYEFIMIDFTEEDNHDLINQQLQSESQFQSNMFDQLNSQLTKTTLIGIIGIKVKICGVLI
jgi:hypothetical protein